MITKFDDKLTEIDRFRFLTDLPSGEFVSRSIFYFMISNSNYVYHVFETRICTLETVFSALNYYVNLVNSCKTSI